MSGFKRVPGVIWLVLVVLATATLGALLYPALTGDNIGIRRVVCLTNLKVISQASILDASDYDDRLPADQQGRV